MTACMILSCLSIFTYISSLSCWNHSNLIVITRLIIFKVNSTVVSGAAVLLKRSRRDKTVVNVYNEEASSVLPRCSNKRKDVSSFTRCLMSHE